MYQYDTLMTTLVVSQCKNFFYYSYAYIDQFFTIYLGDCIHIYSTEGNDKVVVFCYKSPQKNELFSHK